MRLLWTIILITMFIFKSSFVFSEELLDKPIELKQKAGCDLKEYCEKYIKDIDIENFIKEETKKDYVVVSLDECLDVALKNNFDIDIKFHEYKSSKYAYQNALSKFLPILKTTSYVSDYQGQILVGEVLRRKIHETALSVNITAEHYLTKGGEEIFEAKAKKYFQKSRKNLLDFTIEKALFECSVSYYELLLNKIYISIYLRNLIERNAQLDLAINQEKSGFGTNFDVVRSKSEAQYAKAKLLHVLYNFKTAQTKLANLMGISLDTSLMPFEEDVKEINMIDLEKFKIEDLFKLAISNRQDLKSYKNEINYQKEEKNVILTEFFPKPLLSYQQQFQGTLSSNIRPNYILTGLLEWAPGENLSLGTITKIKAKKEEIRAMQKELENKTRNIEEKIVNNYSASEFSKRGILITKERIEYAKESVKLAILRFDWGKGILLDVIQAQSQMTQARVEYAETVIKYNISQISLMFETGQLDKEKLISNYKP